jgi:hypothetical protein
MSSSERSKRSNKKANSSDKKMKNDEIFNLNINKGSINNNNKNNDFKNDNSLGYNNLKIDNNINKKRKEERNNNKIKELIDEKILSLKKKEDKNEISFDINNINDINYEKMFKKIIELNRTLKNLQVEKIRLKKEKNIFLNGFNVNTQNRNGLGNELNLLKNYDYSNDDNYSDNKQYLCNTYNKEGLLKQYEEDLNFFNDLIMEFNEELELIK